MVASLCQLFGKYGDKVIGFARNLADVMQSIDECDVLAKTILYFAKFIVLNKPDLNNTDISQLITATAMFITNSSTIISGIQYNKPKGFIPL